MPGTGSAHQEKGVSASAYVNAETTVHRQGNTDKGDVAT